VTPLMEPLKRRPSYEWHSYADKLESTRVLGQRFSEDEEWFLWQEAHYPNYQEVDDSGSLLWRVCVSLDFGSTVVKFITADVASDDSNLRPREPWHLRNPRTDLVLADPRSLIVGVN